MGTFAFIVDDRAASAAVYSPIAILLSVFSLVLGGKMFASLLQQGEAAG